MDHLSPPGGQYLHTRGGVHPSPGGRVAGLRNNGRCSRIWGHKASHGPHPAVVATLVMLLENPGEDWQSFIGDSTPRFAVPVGLAELGCGLVTRTASPIAYDSSNSIPCRVTTLAGGRRVALPRAGEALEGGRCKRNLPILPRPLPVRTRPSLWKPSTPPPSARQTPSNAPQGPYTIPASRENTCSIGFDTQNAKTRQYSPQRGSKRSHSRWKSCDDRGRSMSAEFEIIGHSLLFSSRTQ